MLTPLQLINAAKSVIKECDQPQLATAIEQQLLIIDVREPAEYSNGHIASAINIPRGLIEFAIFEHPEVLPFLDSTDLSQTPIFVYCKTGGRSALAAQSLQTLGFKHVTSLAGGIQAWESKE